MMDFSKIGAYLKEQKKPVRLLFKIFTIAVVGLLCYQLGENVGEFIYHIMH